MTARFYWLSLFAMAVAMGSITPSRAEPVRVATPSRVIFVLPYWIAERKGYFKDEGLEPTLDIGGDTTALTQKTRIGTLDVVLGGPDGVLIDATRGGPLRILAGVVRRPPLWLIAKPSIKSFADLRGADIGVLSLTEGSSKLLVRMAKAEGLSAGDLKMRAVGGAPARQTLLKEGKIDAGMQPLPLNYEAQELGFTDLGWAGKYEPDWQFITVNASLDWSKQKPQVAAGFVRALLRGQQLIETKPDEAAQIAADVLGTPQKLALRSITEAVRLGIFDARLEWSDTGLRKIYESIQADGGIPADRKFDVGEVVFADYLRAAQKAVTAGGK
jgi:NitT/TauT family transport system substrate-binding protein